MNNVYRIVWSSRLGALVVVSEHGKSRGKKAGGKAARLAGAIAALALTASAATASPAGGQVVLGKGSIAQQGSFTVITQSTGKMGVNWSSFNVGANESVQFVQPGRDSVALNRVVGNDASQILGKISANGQVFLSNPNGVLFGKGSQVDVGGLAATTLGISDADFAAGKYKFASASDSPASVVNQGDIRAADGGYVALIGGSVRNDGSIHARLGSVALGAGSAATLDFGGDGLAKLKIDQGALGALVENRQLIQADGGTVAMSAKAASEALSAAVNNQGVARAGSLETRDGVVSLLAEGKGSSVAHSGTIEASGSVRVQSDASAQVSGQITSADVALAAADIRLNGADISARRSLKVGGGAHGQDASIANASAVDVDAASSLVVGDGGSLVVWSQDKTNFAGSAKGGDRSFVELSSKGELRMSGSALVGVNSHVLFDPTNLVIDAAGGGATTPSAIAAAAGLGSKVTLQATNDITVNSAVAVQGRLELEAGSTLTLNAGLSSAATGDALVLSGSRFVNNAGTSALSAPNGRWLVYSDSPANNVFGGLASGSLAAWGSPYLTRLLQPLSGGNRFAFSMVPTLTVRASDVSKTYDGSAFGVVGYSTSGLVDASLYGGAFLQDTITGSLAVLFPSKNAGVYGIGQGSLVGPKGYITSFVGGQATIAKKGLSISGLTASDKTYDGTSLASISGSAIVSGKVGSDSVGVNTALALAAFGDRNAGQGKAVTVSGLLLTGADAGNYDLSGFGGLTASIAPKDISVSGLLALNKTYDGSPSALLGGIPNLLGVLGSDLLGIDLSQAFASFGDKNVGQNKPVSILGLGLTGADSGNYRFSALGGLTASIVKKPVSISGQVRHGWGRRSAHGSMLEAKWRGGKTAWFAGHIRGSNTGGKNLTE